MHTAPHALGLLAASLTTLTAMTSTVAARDASGDDLARALDEMTRLREQNERIAAANAELAAKVARLEQHAADSGSWLTEARAEEIRAIVGDVLADAAARDPGSAQLLPRRAVPLRAAAGESDGGAAGR